MQLFSRRLRRSIALRLTKRNCFQSGLTLLEVLIVVAVLGLILAGALPAYEESLIRVKIAEGLGLAAPYQDMVAQNAVAGRALNSSTPALSSSSVVRSIAVAQDGVITLSFKPEAFGPNRAASFGYGPTVTLVPSVNGSPLGKEAIRAGSPATGMPAKAVVEWSCATESSALTFGPRGTLPTQFAPPECR
jgi:type IV pilus assembly protein PilA